MTVMTATPSELAALLKSEAAKWGPIIKEAGIKADWYFEVFFGPHGITGHQQSDSGVLAVELARK